MACVSALVRPEVMAVFHRRLREKTWSQRDFTAAIRQFQNDDLAGFWTWLPLDAQILKAAAEAFTTLPTDVFVRSSDCIHIVTALHHGFDELVTYDVYQLKAAAAMGLRPRTARGRFQQEVSIRINAASSPLVAPLRFTLCLMKKILPALALLAACATTKPAGPQPRPNAIDATPAVQLLQASRFADAEAKARELMGQEPGNAQANVVAAIAGYQRTIHQLIQDVITIGMGAFQTHSVNHQYLKFALGNADQDLRAVEQQLATAGADGNFALDLCLACWRHDWNHDGRINQRDETLFQIEVDAQGKEIPDEDPRRKPTFHFDVGDVHWARAMVLFQHAALSIVMAYDLSELGLFILSNVNQTPEAYTLRLVDKDRIKQAKALILDGLAAAERSRQLYLAETDDVNEWVPNPRQKKHPLPLPVDEALYQTWGQILGDVVRLVQGQEGLGIAELAQLGDHRWKTPPRGYLDIGMLLDQPADIVVRRKTLDGLEHLRGEDPAPAEAILREIFGDKYRASMKPSPLLGRLQRMKGEIDRGQESFERKLRYLLWLN